MAKVLSVGAVGFVIQTVIFEALGIRLALVAASTAAVIGGEAAILSNFFLNNRFSFADAERTTALWKRLLRFHLVSSGSLATQWILVLVAEQFTSDVFLLRGAFLVGVGLGFLLNYSGYYFFVWRENR